MTNQLDIDALLEESIDNANNPDNKNKNIKEDDDVKTKHRSRHHRSKSPRDRHRRNRSRSKDRDRHKRSHSRSKSRERRRHRHRSKSRSKSKSHSPSRKSIERERAMREIKRMATSRSSRSILPEPGPDAAERDSRTVFVMQVGARCSERDVEDFFNKVGQVSDVRLIADRNSRRSKGIAYVEFTNKDTVDLAIQLTGQKIQGQPVIIQRTQAEKNRLAELQEKMKKANAGPTKVHISCLHANISEVMIKAVLEPFGQVEELELLKDELGKSKGEAVADFKEPESAKQVADHLNGFVLAGKAIKVVHVCNQLHLEALVSNSNINSSIISPALGLLPSNSLLGTSNVISSCFVLLNLFSPELEKNSNWSEEIQDDVLRECVNYGHVYHILVDQNSQDGKVYVKSQTPSIASSIVNALSGRYFSGRKVSAQFIPEVTYHTLFPGSLSASVPLKINNMA